MKIAVIGTGYVGLVTGTCFANLGHQVICLDNDAEKISHLKAGSLPLYEPGLGELFQKNKTAGRLDFTTDFKAAVASSEVIFITVGTPDKGNGEADLSAIEAVTKQIGSLMTQYKLVVEKSTVPVETGKWIEYTIRLNSQNRVQFDVASNPEFLREGSAVEDFMNPDRIVIGVESPRAEQILRELYCSFSAPVIVTDVRSAELIKHASNSFLSMKISFINAIANICERVGADVVKVSEAVGLDRRIGKDFLNAGVGFGGSCFPKDIAAFIRLADKVGYDFKLLKAVEEINRGQRRWLVHKIENALWILEGKTIGILGLAFKPGTDDLRNAPSLELMEYLLKEGGRVKAYDPQAMEKTKKLFPAVKYCSDPYETARDSDCLVLMTEWDEFKKLDFKMIKTLMKQPILVDGRNLYQPFEMNQMGFQYIGVGRKQVVTKDQRIVEWTKSLYNTL
ncbi:MAG: UDP-glucose/GDP-mannose dehydrogenase family protein [Candidatus Omnitrophica bacterium]|nr:UDP-glucose/GDP-mannose dehydrogenase family protein [Candidatus Omnitrophota bacterium]